jgi:lipoprotein-releasing system permease protein
LYKLSLVLRYLRRRKITIFPIAGVALGVMALVVVLSIMVGFDTDLRRRIRGIMPDMSIEFLDIRGYNPGGQEALDDLLASIEAVPEVRAASPYVSGLAMARISLPAPGGGVLESRDSIYLNYKGFDFARENDVLGLTQYLKYKDDPFAASPYGGDNPAPFVVGARLVGRQFEGFRIKIEDWGRLDKGATIKLTTLTPDWDPSATTGVVADVVKTGIWELDASTLYMPIEWARAFARIGPKDSYTVNGIGIALRGYNPETVASAREHLKAILDERILSGDYRLSTWEDSRRTLLTAIAMERKIMAFILFFFLVVAGFSISAILIMIVLEKVRDIGILRAMGASARGIASIFLLYGATIGIVGAIIGLALGVLFVENINVIEEAVYRATGWEPFPAEIYDLPEIPRIINWGTNITIAFAAAAVSFLAGVLPAFRAARLKPVEAIRYE